MPSSKTSIQRDSRTFDSVKSAFEDFQAETGGGTICSAKWLQTTLHVFNGTTQSCHHCPTYKVDPVEVLKKPSLLHNIPVKVEQRQGMRQGEKHKDCDYCWNAEALGAISDRMTKSTNTEWSIPALDALQTDEPFPSYLEVAFDSTCNLACAYCGPVNSSKWVEDIKRHGDYPSAKGLTLAQLNERGTLPIPQSHENPYREAFWQWWPELYQNLKVFRITGGEPLLSKTAWRVLEHIQAQPREDLIVGINTNLSVEPVFIDKLISFCQHTEAKLKKLQVYTSCEAHGEQAEYIRDGLDFEALMENVDKVLRSTETTTITMMMTLNALSVFSLDRFLKQVFDLYDKYPNRVSLDFVYLRHPSFMDVRVLERRTRIAYLDKAKRVVEKRGSALHQSLFDRFYKHANNDWPEETRLLQSYVFRDFFIEYDRRRDKNLFDTFPELL